MNTGKNSDILSADDLKSQLYKSLHSSGLLKQLKGQLRRSMINELKGNGEKKFQSNIQSKRSDLLASTIKHKKSQSWIHEAIDNLVYLHLKQNGYQYSLSLFEQESCVETYKASLMEDLLQRLGLNLSDLDVTTDTPASSLSEDFVHLTSTPTAQAKDPTLTLWIILEKLSLLAASKPIVQREKSKFLVEEDKPKSLGEKLKAVDEEMQLKSSHQPRDPSVAISSYTAAVRNAEEVAQRRAKAQFEQWKLVELVQFKMDAAKKSKDSVDATIKDLEKDYQTKREALQHRERAAVERLQHQREMLEREMHEQRQSLLSEIEKIRVREEALHKQEQVIQEIELIKHKELENLHDRLGRPKVSQSVSEEEKADKKSSLHSETTDMELKKLQLELQHKAEEMQQLRQELSLLKVEHQNARHFNESQVYRDNLLLRSHIDQLTSGIRASNTIPKETNSSETEEKLRKEIEKLKEERDAQQSQQRHLARTLDEMKQALEDSNSDRLKPWLSTALAHFNAKQPDPHAASTRKDHPNVSDVISNLSPPTKRVNFREYEPVETCLHPALVSSGEYDDPSMDEKVAAASMRLDLLQRMKELENQTYEVDEHYHRYLKTHYRNLENQLSKHATASQPSSIPSSALSKLREFPLSSQPSKKVPDRLYGLEKDVADLDSSPHPVANARKVEAPVTLPGKGQDLRPKQRTGSQRDDFKLFPGNVDEDLTSSSSKTSTEASGSPVMDTARRVEVNPSSQQESKVDLMNPRTFPPIAVPRKLPSLASFETSPTEKKAESPSSQSLLSEKEPRFSLEKSDRVYFGKPRLTPISTDPSQKVVEMDLGQTGAPQSIDLRLDEDKEISQTSESESELAAEPEKRTSVPEPSFSSFNLPPNVPLNRDLRIPDRSEATRSPSAVSEMSLPSFESSTDNPLLSGEKLTAGNEDHFPEKSESTSGRINPVAKDAGPSSSPNLTEEENAEIAEKIAEEKAPKKTWKDFDLSNDEDISEALRYSDAVKPTLDFDDASEPVVETAPIPASDETEEPVEEEPREEVNVFEMDNPESLDSIEIDNENEIENIKSDVSW